MPAPEQMLPDDSDALSPMQTETKPVREKSTRLSSTRVSKETNKPRTYKNDKWYPFQDTTPGKLEELPDKHIDHDLPPDSEYAQLKEEVINNFDDYKDDLLNIEDILETGINNLDEKKKNEIIKKALLTRQRMERHIKLKDHIELDQDRGIFRLKIFMGYLIGTLFGIFILSFVAVFTYTTLTQGVLSDNGIASGILTTIGEVIKIILSPESIGK